MIIDKIEFIASLPPITSAILISGNNDGARIKLDIPASELYAVIQLQLLSGKAFKVIVEPIDEKPHITNNKVKFLKDVSNE